MDEKGACLKCLTKEKVIVLSYIKEMYIRVLENRKSLTIIESIATDKTAISFVIIVLG